MFVEVERHLIVLDAKRRVPTEELYKINKYSALLDDTTGQIVNNRDGLLQLDDI